MDFFFTFRFALVSEWVEDGIFLTFSKETKVFVLCLDCFFLRCTSG